MSASPDDIPTGLKAFDMMSGDADIYFVDFEVGVRFDTVLHCLLDGTDGLIDVQHHTVLHSIAVCLSEAEDFEFTELVLPAGDGGDLGRPNVEPYDHGLFFRIGCILRESG
jgi:hypothetical protein